MSDKFDLGTTAWLAAMESAVKAAAKIAARDGDLADADHSMCEIYTNVPTNVSEVPEVSWHIVARDGCVKFARGVRDDVNVKITIDWATAARMAKVHFPDGAEPMSVLGPEIAQASAEGKITIAATKPNRTPKAFAGLHNAVATFTA